MDLGSAADWANAIITLLGFIATVISIKIAITQFRETTQREENNKLANRYFSLRKQGKLVDSWITRVGPHWKIFISNNSNMAIRDVQVHVYWPNLPELKDKNLEKINKYKVSKNYELDVVPQKKNPWKLLQSGNYIIEPKQNLLSAWSYPEPTNDISDSPQYFKSHSLQKEHCLIALVFTDNEGNRWCKVFNNPIYKYEPGLYLISSPDERLLTVRANAHKPLNPDIR